MVGVLIPSRGLIFAEAIKSLAGEIRNKDVQIYVSTNLPIPDSHNRLVEKALADGCEAILFLEEDIAIPAGAYERLQGVQADIACIDYGVSGWSCITKNRQGEILWCGLGCTMVKKVVFEALEYPYFRADMALMLPEFKWRELPSEYVKTKNYGNLDIWFFTKAREKGFKIVQVEGEAAHLKLDSLGQPGVNNGIHRISEKPKITKHQVL